MTKCADCGKNTNRPRSWGEYQAKNLCPSCWSKRLKNFIEALRRV